MADVLDAELLALAGGDSSDEEDTKPTATTIEADSPSSSLGNPSSNTDGTSANKFAVAQTKAAKMKATAGKRNKGTKDESEEEGEMSSTPASLNSLQSAPMSESETEGLPAGEVDDEGPIFPVDNKFYSEKDKAEIMSMSEVERESILAERAQLLERKQQDLTLRRLLQGYQAKEGDKSKSSDQKKRKAGAAEIEEVQRKSSRQKTTLGGRKVGETSDAMEAYKRQREQKGLRDEQRKREGEQRKERKRHGSNDDGFSDADADGESDVDFHNNKPRTGHLSESVPRDEQPADLLDYNHVRLGRDNFGKVCFYPGFEDAIKQCFVRVSIGPDKANPGQNIYRVAQIKGFKQGKPYALEGVNGKPFATNQYALLAVGKSEREWPFLACSNSKFTQAEFDRYKRTLSEEGLALPTKPFLISKINDINSLINHRFTDQEIQEKLKRSGVLRNKLAIFERSSIAVRRKEAEARGDEATIAKLDVELAALDGPKLAFGTSLYKSPNKAPSGVQTQQQRLAEINRANRKANTEEVRKAQRAEIKAHALARRAVERGEAVANAFARVKTLAKTHHDVNKYLFSVPCYGKDDLFESSSRDNSRAGTPLSQAGTNTPLKTLTPSREGTPSLLKQTSEDKTIGWQLAHAGYVDQDYMLSLIDFGIEIEL